MDLLVQFCATFSAETNFEKVNIYNILRQKLQQLIKIQIHQKKKILNKL